jgi:hypothetical protein
MQTLSLLAPKAELEEDTSPAMDLGLVQPDVCPTATYILGRAASALAQIGRGSDIDQLQRIYEVAPHHGQALERLIERIPSATLRPVVESALRITDPDAGLPVPDAKRLRRAALHAGHDPRSYREGVRILGLLQEAVTPGSLLDRTWGRALQLLDDKRVLGMKRLVALGRFLEAVERRPSAMVLRGANLQVGDDVLALPVLEDHLASLRHHSQMWAAQAASLVLYADTHQYGAQSLPQVRTPHRQTLLPSETSLAFLPGRTAERQWMKIDPVPAQLQIESSDQAIHEMRAIVDLWPIDAWRAPEARSTLQVVYAGVRVAMAIVQPLWLARFKVGIELDEGEGPACYVADGRKIRISRGPLSAWSIVHELAHAIDDVVLEGDGFASDKPGHPLCAFADLVRPAYRRVAEDRARSLWIQLLDETVGSTMRVRLEQGLVPLHQVLEGIHGLEPEEQESAAELVVGDQELGEAEVRAKISEVGPGGVVLLGALQDGYVEDSEGHGFIDIEEAYRTFLHDQLLY